MTFACRSCVGWLAVAVVLMSCAPASETPGGGQPGLTDADRAEIAAAADSVAAAGLAGDGERWASYYAADAQQLAPNMEPLIGRAAIAAYLATFPPITKLRFVQDSVWGTGDMAVVQGRYELELTPPGGPVIQDNGKYLEFWRRDSDGRWRVARDAFNSSVPLPTP